MDTWHGARITAPSHTCAGGWVRDKLLGRDSLDIDIALDNCLGKDFAEKVNDYLRAQVGVFWGCF